MAFAPVIISPAPSLALFNRLGLEDCFDGRAFVVCLETTQELPKGHEELGVTCGND